MSLARTPVLRTLSFTLRHSGTRATARAAALSRTQLVARRYASGGSHGGHGEAKSDLPWMISALAITPPAAWFLWPDKSHAEHHGEHGGHDEHAESEEKAGEEEEEALAPAEKADEPEKGDEAESKSEESTKPSDSEGESKSDESKSEGSTEDAGDKKEEQKDSSTRRDKSTKGTGKTETAQEKKTVDPSGPVTGGPGKN